MKITLIFGPAIAEAVGNKELVLNFSARKLTVAELLRQITIKYPQTKTILYENSGEPNPNILIFLNDRPLTADEEKKTLLHDGDTLRFLILVGGG